MLTEMLIQFGALAQGPDIEGLVEILFIAVMVILWLVGGLVKAVGSKRSQPQPQRRREGLAQEQRRPRETWQQRLAHKVEEMQHAAEVRSRETGEARAQSGQPGPVRPLGGNVVIRSGQRGESVLVYQRPEKQVPAEPREQPPRQREAADAVAVARRYKPVPPPPTEAQITGLTSTSIADSPVSALGEPPAPIEPGVGPLTTPRASAGSQVIEVIDYSDAEALKKAILHYEILGKPLALREASDETPIF